MSRALYILLTMNTYVYDHPKSDIATRGLYTQTVAASHT